MARISLFHRIVTAVGALVLAGYLSSILSAAGCTVHTQRTTAQAASSRVPAGSIHWLKRSELRDELLWPSPLAAEWRMRSRLFPLHLYLPVRPHVLPWAYCFSESVRYPYIARVWYGYKSESRRGRLGVRVYLCLLGWNTCIADWPTGMW